MAKKKGPQFFWLLVVGFLLGGGGYLIYEMFWGSLRATPEKALAAAQKAFDAGTDALAAGKPATAVIEFDNAQRQADRAAAMLLDERQKPENQRADLADALKQQSGQAYWVKARALRDRAYAQAQTDGSPLAEITDSTTGEKFRTVLVIPVTEDRTEALLCLRNAALLLGPEAEIQREALRAELMLTPVSWKNAAQWARNLIDKEPNNARARYVLARYRFEQPKDAENAPGQPTPWEERDEESVRDARAQLELAKKADNWPLWRILHLDAQITRWLLDKANQDKNEKAAQAEARALDQLLLDKEKGALARSARGEGLDGPLSSWDVEGVLALHELALTRALAVSDQGAPPGPAAMAVLDQGLGFCQQQAKKHPDTWAVPAALTAAALLETIQPRIVERDGTWRTRLAEAQKLARAGVGKQPAALALYEAQGRLLAREGDIEERDGNDMQASLVRKQALEWVEDGLRAGENAKAEADQLTELNKLATRLKGAEARLDELDVHLTALRASPSGPARAVAYLYDGLRDEQAGRLRAARDNLERAREEDPAVGLRAHLLLGGVYLALGQAGDALYSLRRAQEARENPEGLGDAERAWMERFLPDRADLIQMLLLANLGEGMQKARRHAKRHPGSDIPFTLVEKNERAARDLLAQLGAGSAQRRAARLAVIHYHIRTGRTDVAREEVRAFRSDYPESLEGLQEELALRIRVAEIDPDRPLKLPEDLRANCDARIQAYLADFPDRPEGKRFWARWLIRTDRPAEAVAYLEDPKTFSPGSRDQQYHRVRALARQTWGEREDGPAATLLLAHVAASRAEGEEQIPARTRQERQGLYLCWEAETHFGKGELEESVRDYYRALEYQHIRPLASFGLGRSLFALAEVDPRQARARALEMIGTSPDETAPYLGFAYAALLLDDLGTPGAGWEGEKSLATALERWERLVAREGLEATSALLTKAEFWGWANRVRRGYADVAEALRRTPEEPRALRLGVRLLLDLGSPLALDQAGQLLATLRKVRPDDPRTALLGARLLEKEGKVADAVRAYESLLTKHPREKPAYVRLLDLLERGKDKDIGKWVGKWRAAMPAEGEAVLAEVRHLARAGDRPEAHAAADRFVEMESKALDQRLKAREGPPVGDPAVVRAEADRESRAQAAAALAEGGDLEEAASRADRLLKDNPDLLAALLVKGQVHEGRAEWGPARAAYEAVLSHDPRHRTAASRLARVLLDHADDPHAAYRVVSQARKGRFRDRLLPGDRLPVGFLDVMGRVYRKVGRDGRWAEMRDLFELAVMRYPADPRMYLYLGVAYAGLEQEQAAQRQFDAALAGAAPEARNELTAGQRQAVAAAVKAERSAPEP